MIKRFRLGSALGIPLNVDVTLLFALPAIAWLIATRVGRLAPVLSRWLGVGFQVTRLQAGAWPWVLGVAAAFGLFASVGLHEFGHSVVALWTGHDVDAITLWILGGVAEFDHTPEQWREEFVIAVAGPVVSVALGGLCYGAASVLPAGSDRLLFVLGYLSLMNLVLAAFNLLPAFPLDGGRVLRALLARDRPVAEATTLAARVGKVMAVLFAVVGVLSFNLLLIAIAFFVYVGAEAEATQTKARAAFDGVTVRDLMTPAPDLRTVSPDTTLDDLYERMYSERHTGYPVMADGSLVGVVTLADLSEVPPDERAATTVEAVMSTDLVTADPDEDAADALQRIETEGVSRLLVVDERDELVGLLSRTDLVKAFTIARSAPGHPTESDGTAPA